MDLYITMYKWMVYFMKLGLTKIQLHKKEHLKLKIAK